MRRDSVGSYLVWLVLVNKTWFADIKYTLGCSSCLGEGEKERRTEEGGREGEGEDGEKAFRRCLQESWKNVGQIL